MSDLVERLRIRQPLLGKLCDEAADRIEALEAALQANLDIIDMFIKQTVGGQSAIDAVARLRAALVPEQDKCREP